MPDQTFTTRGHAVRFALLFSLAALLCFITGTARGQGDGIFADFNTSMGSFTCRLHYAQAPRTVANFIGLATGQRGWLDAKTGEIRQNPFYDGTLFHRIVHNFMSQAGTRAGAGPGYSFLDEFSPSLRHTNFGVLSMANAGPDSNGSQLFLTVSPATYLDNKHSVFGQVIGGSNVVYAINHVATNLNETPVTDIVIQTVRIRRVGTLAQAFDIHAHGLPTLSYVPLKANVETGQVVLSFSNRLHVANHLCESTDMRTWNQEPLGFEIFEQLAPKRVPRQKTNNFGFYRLTRVEYPSDRPTPGSLTNRVLTLGGNLENLVITLNSVGGSYTFDPYYPPGNITSYSWNVDAYRGRLQPIYFSGLVPMVLHLAFTNATGGTYSGTAYTAIPSEVFGPFRLSR